MQMRGARARAPATALWDSSVSRWGFLSGDSQGFSCVLKSLGCVGILEIFQDIMGIVEIFFLRGGEEFKQMIYR